MTEVLVAIIVAGSTLLGVRITQRHESKRRQSEERRWYADYFLGRKIDALNNLYAALVDCHLTMNFYGNCRPSTVQEFKDRVLPKEEAYLRAKVTASIYLGEEADKIMSQALGAFRQASMAIWLSLPDEELRVNKESYGNDVKNVNWERLKDRYDQAVDCLRNLLNPKVLDIAQRPQ